MQQTPDLAISAEVQNPGAAIVVGGICARVMQGQGMMNGEAAHVQRTGNGTVGIESINCQGTSGAAAAGDRVGEQPAALGAWNEPHAAVLDGRGLEGNPKMNRA